MCICINDAAITNMDLVLLAFEKIRKGTVFNDHFDLGP